MANAFKELPFILRPKGRKAGASSNWHVPPAADYGAACAIGRNFAAHFLQYIKEDPDRGQTLGTIAKDIDFNDKSANAGYWVGFFSHIERYIAAGCRFADVFADLKREDDIYSQINDAREAEDRRAMTGRVARMNAAKKAKRGLALARIDPNFQKVMARLKDPSSLPE